MSSEVKNPKPPELQQPEPPDTPEQEVDGEGARMSFFEHLDELRQRLFKVVLALVAGTVVGVLAATPVLEYLQKPYGQTFLILEPTGGVIEYFRVSLLIGGIISIPIVTYQVLLFILPGLTHKERRYLFYSIGPVTILFLIGVAFAWFVLIPPALTFLTNFQPQLFKTDWTADRYLAFVTALMFWMGVAFETPLIFFVLSIIGVVTPRPLLHNWRIAVVGAAIAAAVITPTIDPVNMFLVMGPLMGLYLLSILLVSIGVRFNRAQS
jgi:sec-independent protein translocase protein TatC